MALHIGAADLRRVRVKAGHLRLHPRLGIGRQWWFRLGARGREVLIMRIAGEIELTGIGELSSYGQLGSLRLEETWRRKQRWRKTGNARTLKRAAGSTDRHGKRHRCDILLDVNIRRLLLRQPLASGVTTLNVSHMPLRASHDVPPLISKL